MPPRRENVEGKVTDLTQLGPDLLVRVDRGRGFGLKAGMHLHVYRGSQYTGRLDLIDVQCDHCIARVEYEVSGGSISEGDAATIHLPTDTLQDQAVATGATATWGSGRLDPEYEASVIEVHEEERRSLVRLDRGARHGLRPGERLVVFDSTIHMVRVAVVRESDSTGVVWGPVRVGDHVGTLGPDHFGLDLALPHINGTVAEVSHVASPGLVALDVGYDDGVRRGFTFEVYLNNQYKGRVRVMHIQKHRCSAVIVKLYEGRTIEQGDSATTHI